MPRLMNRRDFLKLMITTTTLIGLGKLGEYIYQHQPKSSSPFAGWYVVQVGNTPEVSLSNYSLTIDGEVKNPLRITYDELLSMPSATVKDNIQCVSDPYFLSYNVTWKGVPLKYILQQAQPLENAIKILTFGADGYTADLPIWKAMEDSTLIAYEANNMPLTTVHGYPVRLVVPRWWGYTYTKWLFRIHVTNKNVLGYWESLGYPDIARKNLGE